MILNKVPPNIAGQIKNLTVDEQFQKRFAEDKILDTLEAQKHDKNISFQELLLLITRRTFLLGISFKPMTLALYSYLYSIQSNIIKNINKATKEDLDIFFYLLQTKNFTRDVKELLFKSSDYGNKELGLDYNAMIFVFNKLYSIEFKVLSLFPRITNGEQQPIFDVDWMLNITSKVKPYVSYSTQQIYTEVPVMQLYYYYAQYLRNNGSESIFVRSDEEILDEMDSRMIDMVIQRLVQKNVLTKDQYKEIFDLLKQNKEKTDGK